MTKQIALQNCRMLAQREIRRWEGGDARKPTGITTLAAWKHILRFCEEAGVTGLILRDATSKGNSSLIADPGDRAPRSKRKLSLDEIEAARDMRADMYGENGNG